MAGVALKGTPPSGTSSTPNATTSFKVAGVGLGLLECMLKHEAQAIHVRTSQKSACEHISLLARWPTMMTCVQPCSAHHNKHIAFGSLLAKLATLIGPKLSKTIQNLRKPEGYHAKFLPFQLIPQPRRNNLEFCANCTALGPTPTTTLWNAPFYLGCHECHESLQC